MHYTPLSTVSRARKLAPSSTAARSYVSLFLYFTRLASSTASPIDDIDSGNEHDGNVKERHRQRPKFIQRYPFPRKPLPTAHEIFHLPPHTPSHAFSKQALKARYYELVKEHHPDSVYARELSSSSSPTSTGLSDKELRRRFQMIGEAWEVLSGKKAAMSHHTTRSWTNTSPATSSGMRGSRHTYYPGYAGKDWNADWAERAGTAEENADDRWKDRVIMAVGVTTLAIGLTPFLRFQVASNDDKKHREAASNLAQARRDAKEYGMLRRKEIQKMVRTMELEDEFNKQNDSRQ